MRFHHRIATFALFAACTFAAAQQRVPVDDATANTVLAKSATTFPKFHHEFESIKAQDKLIKKIAFVRQAVNKGPAFASPDGVITIDISYLEDPKPNFDDNRLIVVLYHELGHLHYFKTVPRADWTPMASEKAAFEYSLLRTKGIAEKGDCGPLATGVRFMKLRSEGNNMADPHVRALKVMVHGPLYAGYVDYVKVHCPGESVTPQPGAAAAEPQPQG